MKRVFVVVCLIITAMHARGQDPSFSQFFSSPLNVNPALTGNINGDWRVISNFRDQWIGPSAPYATGTLSYDTKLSGDKMLNVPDNNYFGLGGMMMYDRAMSGIVNSSYASANLSYSIKLTEGEVIHRLTMGFGAGYGHRGVDFTRLQFQEQFTGTGFNHNMPTGESALSDMKAFFSANAGLTYSIKSEFSNLDLGFAGFHLNKPRQSFMADENQRLATRYVAHANFESLLTNRVVLNTNAIYQRQINTSYISAGGGLGYYISEDRADHTMLNLGAWYWSKNAVVVYVGYVYNNLQFGFSYDVTTSNLNNAPKRPNTWEMSIIYRGIKDATGIIPCPWK